MIVNLATAVYTAFRGYSWSRIPIGLTERIMDQLRELAAERRGEFPDAEAVERGVVAIGPVAAAFSIRNVSNWDSNGRASEYSAFAFFKAAEANMIDFNRVLDLPFFNIPTREVPDAVVYDGDPAALSPLTAAGQLVCKRHLDALPAAQGGDILAKYFNKSNRWIFRMNDDGTMSVDCAEWKNSSAP